MTGPWLVRRLAGDARRHTGAWLGIALAFALAAFCAAGARVTTHAGKGEAAAAVEPSALVITYLKDDLPPADVAALQRVLAGLPGVEAARLVSPREALERLRGELGARAAIVDGVGPELLFSSIEVTVRPAGAASALAFRLRRLAGVADVDLVAPPAGAATTLPARFGVAVLAVAVGGGVLGLAVVLLIGGAFVRLRGRYRGELRVLAALGLSRPASARPAVVLATGAGALGVAAGLLAAFFAARVLWGGPSLPAREWGGGAAALILTAYVLSAGVLRVRDVVEAR